MMNRILCPVDFSECSLNAVEFAAKIGAAHQASLTLIHVFTEEEFGKTLSSNKTPDRYKQPNIDDLGRYAENTLQHLSEEVLRMEGKHGLADCNYQFTYGSLNQQIIDYAQEHRYSMIVMGTTGVKDIFEEYIGSNTAKTIKQAPCPVLCIPTAADYHIPQKIMYATDYQQEDIDVLTRLTLFAEPFKARLHVVHLSHHNNLREQAAYQDFQKQVKDALPQAQLQFEKRAYEDDIAHSVDQHAIDQSMDIVALLHQRRNFFERLLEGSTVKDISYFATYPVLVYREAK
ncbi:MAG: universal stress protein [Bacteroidota bacterium]